MSIPKAVSIAEPVFRLARRIRFLLRRLPEDKKESLEKNADYFKKWACDSRKQSRGAASAKKLDLPVANLRS
jgi:hypothetical protein